MAFQPTEDGLRIIYRFQSGTWRWTNHLWASKPDYTDTDVNALLDEIEDNLDQFGLGALSDATSMYQLDAVDERTQGASSYIRQLTGITGTASGDKAAVQLACVVTLRTALRGRAYRGRVYIAGHAEQEITNGMFTANAQEASVSLANFVRTSAIETGWTAGVRSGFLNGVQRQQAIVVPIIAAEVRSAIPGSQRRRSNRF